MTDWATLRSRIRSVSRDDITPYQIADEVLLAYANYALDWVAIRHPRTKSDMVALVERTGSLPADFIQAIAVIGDNGAMEESDGYVPARNEYTLYAEDTLKVGDDELTEVTLLYQGGYDAIVVDGDAIPVPGRLEEAHFLYTCSRTLYHLAVDSGDISQWDTRTDSGHPEHNPILRMAETYEKLANTALSRPVTL